MNLYPYRTLMLFLLALLSPICLQAQDPSEFTRADTLRGSLTPERAWWNVLYYDLHVNVQPEDSTISGQNNITFRVVDAPRKMQIDLQEPLEIDRVIQNGKDLSWKRKGDAFFIDLPGNLETGSVQTVSIHYSGSPRIAPNPPWDGGFIWAEDENVYPWIATANQGLGASVWWPNKDHQSEEPDSMSIHITVPNSLVNVSNGRLVSQSPRHDGTTTWSWFVSSPINNYNVAVNAGNYVNFRDTLKGEKGTLDLDYWVLEQNLDLAREQFKQVKPMLQCFEYWFGPYPFYEDSFKLVETPHLGMEHQSAIAYGNNFQNGYLGTDLSGTGWGLRFDFIIIHETGHEWFGNNLTTQDIADMWVHEGFTNYSESLYVECMFGREAGAEYVIGTRQNISNQSPVIGTYGVNQRGSGDMYSKGGNLLHTIRQIFNDDEKWRQTLREMNEIYRHSIVTSKKIEAFINRRIEYDLQPVFDQYLRHTDIPVLEYYIEADTLFYRWWADVEDFDMPVKARLSDDGYSIIRPTTENWKSTSLDLEGNSAFEVDRNFYIRTHAQSKKKESM
ncbi:MAG: M1 family metallopeptidase [Balneolaceae bacterium]